MILKNFLRIILTFIALVFLFTFLNPFAYSNNPFLGNKAAINIGKEIYKERCAKCHGSTARGINNAFSITPDLRKFK